MDVVIVVFSVAGKSWNQSFSLCWDIGVFQFNTLDVYTSKIA